MIQPIGRVIMSQWCTMAVGGPAQWFVRATSEQDVLEALAFADAQSLPVFVLGGGSNVVIADTGFPGVVIQVAIEGVEAVVAGDATVFRVGAGEPWDPFVARTVAANCAGLECLSGIPGFVGGTPIQNVGAYGQEVASTIRSLRVVDRRRRTAVEMSPADCAFGYRTSRFKHRDAERFIVTRVDFALRPGGPPTITYADLIDYFGTQTAKPGLSEVRDAVIEVRARKGMVIRSGNPANQSCGSFFVNPIVPRTKLVRIGDPPHYPVGPDRVKIPAAWLIERAGFPRGMARGRVGISPFQAQGLINRGGASAAEVVGLALAIKRAVLDAFAVALVPEPVFVGFANDAVRWLLDPCPDN